MKLYRDFHRAILENDSALITNEIKPHARLTVSEQFSIYADGYRIRLAQAIRSDYPVLLKLLGNFVFDSLAQAYIEANPPVSYNLDFYPHGFAGFVSKNCSNRFAVELATLEAAVAEVFMLADSNALSMAEFSNITPENFADMTMKLRMSCRLIEFLYPVSDWLSAARSQENLPDAPMQSKNFLVVVRHNNEVQRHSLCEQEFSILENLSNGKTVAASLEDVMDKEPEKAGYIAENIRDWFMKWVVAGIFANHG